MATVGGNVLRAAPPLSITSDEVDELAQIRGASIRDLQDEVSRSAATRAAASV
ncbi:MAG TPA: hypothetical protein VMN03_05220 [Burkholderiales bacterium]|nr:hypothetical protein [Burkholderiales bacterium]